MTTNHLDDEISTIMARIGARVVDAPEPTQAERDTERVKAQADRRVKAMMAIGWERRPLALARDAAYDEARATAYLSAMRAVDARKDGGIVVLAGNPGSGKTAAAARWAFTRERDAPRFMRAAEFFRSSRYTRGDEGDRTATRDDVLRSRALVLDDAGAEYADANGSYRVDLDELIDRFYADARVLVITTNIVYATPAQRDAAKGRGGVSEAPTFLDRYGERVTDRIRECGRWVSSAAASQRGRS